MAPPSILLLLLFLAEVSGVSIPPTPPRVSFLLNSKVRPLVHYRDPDVRNTTVLLLSDNGSTLYVGGRDAILSLDVSQSDVITLKKKVLWRPSEAETEKCRQKGKNATVDCPNFIRVLQQINSTHLYVCGSFAFGPRDGVIDTLSFSLVELGSAKGRCPFNPLQSNSAIVIDGELFTASTSDFKGVNPQISRHLSTDARPDIILDSSVILLEEPTFIGTSSDPTQRKLYFFFTEIGKEFRYLNDLRVARVAQVCKDDVGGQRTLQRKWTSFAKATLLCGSSKQLPYSILQDVFTLSPLQGADTVYYGVFTSQWSSTPESAVCIFRLQDVRSTFTRSYRKFDTETHQWSPLLGNHPYLGKCDMGRASDTELEEVKRSFLTSDSVRPDLGVPVLVSLEHRYSKLAAMSSTAADGKQYQVLFLLTESGFLHKVVLLDQGPWIIEEIQVFPEAQPRASLLLSTAKGVLFIGTSEGITSVPLSHCSIYRTCSQCIMARDPQCGWSLIRGVCDNVNNEESVIQDVENGINEKCPSATAPSTDLFVHVNQWVELLCVSPSQRSRLSWSSTLFRTLPQRLFKHPAEGSLVFQASVATAGSYSCEAVEDGQREVIVVYHVKMAATPRSVYHDEIDYKDESYEEIKMEGPVKPAPGVIPPSERRKEQEFPTSPSHLTTTLDGLQTTTKLMDGFWTDCSSCQETSEATCEKKSYYNGLVVVSLLLILCIGALVASVALLWHRSDHNKKVNPLVDTADVVPELKGAE